MTRLRQMLRRLAERVADVLQPRIAQQVRAERPDIHEARQRVHYLVLLAELARVRRTHTQQ
jgi:hypothetical protein